MSEPYASIEQLQSHIDASGGVSWNAADADNLTLALEAASRWLDERLDTRFRAVSETRYYTARWYDLLHIDDLVSLTSLKTDDDDDGDYETTWAATDYRLEPRNAAVKNRPYRTIRYTSNGRYSFPTKVDDGVEVTGLFGYSAEPPAPIVQACLLMAHRLWMRKDAIFGVAGTPGLGVTVVQAQIREDADILAMLAGIDRRGF
jgi:hypothetical protein